MRIRGVGWRTVEVQLSRCLRADAGKLHRFSAAADVQRLARAQVKRCTVDQHFGRATDIDQAQFPPFQEVAGACMFGQRFAEGHAFAHRHDATHDDAVDLAVGQRHRVGLKHVFDQEVTAQAIGVQGTGVVAVDRLTNVHGVFSPYKWGQKAGRTGRRNAQGQYI